MAGPLLRFFGLAWAFLLACAVAAAAETATSHEGVALVIGQSTYEHLPPLANPVNDARQMEMALQALGFETTVATDLNVRKLSRALDNFTEDAEGAGVAVIYYSGHGIEAGGDNWLVPVDAQESSHGLEDRQLVSLSRLTDKLAGTVPLLIVFLDACRSNPFPPGTVLAAADGREFPVASAGLGLSRGAAEAVQEPSAPGYGALIGFAAEPGRMALDGPSGGNSPYAAALVRHLSAMDGAEIGTVMRMVTEEVYLKTEGAQRPWVNETLTRLVYIGAPPPPPGGDEGRILSERRQLLVSMAKLSPVQRQQVEAAARTGGIPMDALYGLLRALGGKAPADPIELGKVLEAQAARVKALLASEQALAGGDAEIARLTRLAGTALRDGALEAHLEFRQLAKARYQAIATSLDETEALLRARRLEGGEVLAGSAAAHELTADYGAAAADYALAFGQVAQWDRARAWEYKRREADAWLSQGDERGDVGAVARSLATFGEALALAPRQAKPHEWAWTMNNLGNALLVRARGDPTSASLEEAIATYRAALEERQRLKVPWLWAKTQSNLALALTELAERSGDATLYADAIVAYRAALSETPRGAEPLLWATIMSNLGNALEHAGGTSLEEAVAAHRAALEERPRGLLPIPWAASQQNLGNALDSLGHARGDAALIRQAIDAYGQALGAVTREGLPLVWAGIHYNLGKARGHLAELENAAENGREAIAAYREALKEESFERSPQAWAKTQYMLGQQGWKLGEALPDMGLRQEAVAALRESLRYYTRGRNEADWAITLHETAIKLHRLGVLAQDAERLAEASAMLRQSLDFYTRERDAAEWAATLARYAAALSDHGFLTGNRTELDEAASAFRAAMEVNTREAAPQQWAAGQLNLASTLYYLAVLANDDGSARQGRAAVEAAAEAFASAGEPARARAAAALLADFDALIAQLPP